MHVEKQDILYVDVMINLHVKNIAAPITFVYGAVEQVIQ